MKTNFFRSTIILVLVLIVPLIFSCISLAKKYSIGKTSISYIASVAGIVILGLTFIAGFSLLVYTIFFAKDKNVKPG